MAIRGILDGWREHASGQKVYCLNCGATNSASQSACLNCEKELERPASLGINLLGLIIRPVPTAQRLVATAPIMQAFLVVLLAFTGFMVLISLSQLFVLETVLANIAKILGDPNLDQVRQFYLKLTEPPTPSIEIILIRLLYSIVQWLLYTAAIYFSLKFFFKQEISRNFYSLLTITGFSRITIFLTFLIFIPVFNIQIFEGFVLGDLFRFIPLVWQLVLILFGVRALTGLSLNRVSLAVIAPSLLFLLFFQPLQF